MHRAHLPAEERRRRAQLAQLVADGGLLRGSLVVRHRVCGRPNCHCAQGEKHVALYLTAYQDGRSRQLYIPRDKEELARQWVENFQRVRQLLQQVSETCWKRLTGG